MESGELKHAVNEYLENSLAHYMKKNNPSLYDRVMDYSQFLNNNKKVKMMQRCWHIINDVDHIVLCQFCKKIPVSWNTAGLYYTYCTASCANKSPIKKAKTEAIFLEKYGTTSYTQTASFKEKAQLTFLERYGTRHYTQSEDYAEKTKKINQTRHGVDYYFQSKEFYEKASVTFRENYGAEYRKEVPDEIKEKMVETNRNKYGSDWYLTSEEKLQLNAKYHDRHNDKRLTPEQWNLLHDREYLIKLHHDDKNTLSEIASLLKVDDTTICNYFNFHDIKVYKFYKSGMETEMFNFLSMIPDIEIESSVRTIIYPWELDIFVSSHNIALEFNGLYWHSERFKDKNYHKTKTDLCKKKGISLLHIFEDEWLEKKDLIKDKLLHILGKSSKEKIYARKCTIIEINTESKRKFFDANHIQGDGLSTINYGLEYGGELVAVLGFDKEKDHYILNRYATNKNVVGGFTKLLKHFEREYNYPKIITFVDLRWSEGKLFYNSGFKLESELPPDYYWTKRENRWHKSNWRHSEMKNKLENYDPNLSETENMHNHGFLKIWDCGKLKFIKN